MKKTYMIIVLAIGVYIAASSTALAQTPSGGISFISEMQLYTAQMPSCGDGLLGDNAAGQGEECEFDADSNVWTSSPSGVPEGTGICPTGFTCNPQTCLCDPPPPICGNGISSGQIGEQCEALGKDGNPRPQEDINGMCNKNRTSNYSWASSIPNPESGKYACADCICVTCGNGVIDADYDEQCEQDSDCQGDKTCTDCACVEGTTASDVPQTECAVKVYGFSNKSSEKKVQSLNARVHEILGTDAVDLFGEEIYSRFIAQMRFYDSVIKSGTELDASLTPKLIKQAESDVDMTSTAIIKYNGGYESSLAAMTFRPLPDEHIMTPALLFPRGSATNVAMSKSQAGKDIPLLMPDLSAAGIAFETDLSFMGDVNMKVVDESEMSINDTIRFKVVPHIPAKSGELAPKEVLIEAFLRPAPASFLGGGDLVHMDPREVLARLATVAAEWKEAGRKIDCGIVSGLTGLQYAPNMRSTYLVASDTINAKTGKAGPLRTKAFGVFAVRTESAFGGKGTGCSLTAAQAHAPQLGMIGGFLVASLVGIGIVRRRKK